MRFLFFVLILLPVAARAIPEEEKTRGCRDLAAKVLPQQRKVAMNRCLEWANNECERIERQFHESCTENSHSDNAIKYDMERGALRYCEAALMKRETHRVLCDGLRVECRENKVTMGTSSAQGTCSIFRDEKDKRICVMVEEQADRIIEAEKAEKAKCAAMAAPAKPSVSTTTHGTSDGSAGQPPPTTKSPAKKP